MPWCRRVKPMPAPLPDISTNQVRVSERRQRLTPPAKPLSRQNATTRHAPLSCVRVCVAEFAAPGLHHTSTVHRLKALLVIPLNPALTVSATTRIGTPTGRIARIHPIRLGKRSTLFRRGFGSQSGGNLRRGFCGGVRVWEFRRWVLGVLGLGEGGGDGGSGTVSVQSAVQGLLLATTDLYLGGFFWVPRFSYV